jgi:hypothetical protein
MDLAATRTRDAAVLRRSAGAWSRRCSLAVTAEGEEDEAEPEVGSPENERWWRGSVTATKDGSGSSLVRERRRVRERWGERGGGAVVAGGPRGFI